MAQAEQLKQQTLATLSDRDQQLRQLTALLDEARARTPKVQQERYQREVGCGPISGLHCPHFVLFFLIFDFVWVDCIARCQHQGSEEVDSAPGAPQDRSQLDSHAYIAEVKELQRR